MTPDKQRDEFVAALRELIYHERQKAQRFITAPERVERAYAAVLAAYDAARATIPVAQGDAGWVMVPRRDYFGDNDRDRYFADGWNACRTAMIAASPAPSAGDEGDALDAARYRFLRTKVGFDPRWNAPFLACGLTKIDPNETDRAIDASLQESEAGRVG